MRLAFVLCALASVVPAQEEAVLPPPPDIPLAFDLDGAISVALGGNHQVRRERHALAASQSSLLVAENEFDFKLRTALSEEHRFIQDRVYYIAPIPPPPGPYTYRQDHVNDIQALGFNLSRPVEWGGRFDLTTSFDRIHDVAVTSADPLHSSFAELRYTHPLWRGRGRRYATSALVDARTRYQDTSRRLGEQETRLVVDVTRAFFAVIRAEKLIDINEQAVKDATARLDTARLRLNEGLITPIEVSRADRDVQQRSSGVIDARQELEAARDRLLVVLGLQLSTQFRLISEETFEPVELDAPAALDEAMAQRAELANAHDELELATLSADVARSDKAPQIDLSLAASYDNVDEATEASKWFSVDPEYSWTGKLVFSHVFGDKADNEALVQALIAEDVAKIDLEEVSLLVAEEVRDTLRGIRSLESQIDVLKQNRDLAKESLRLSTLQFNEGLISTSDLTVDQLSAVQAETDYVNAIYDHAVERARLELVLGRYRTPSLEHRSQFLRQGSGKKEAGGS